jgi:signal transduction histidine kinase
VHRTVWSVAWRWGFMVGMGGLAWAALASEQALVAPDTDRTWLYVVDPALGFLAMAAATMRRRHALLAALLTSVLGIGSATATGALLLTLGSIAFHKRDRALAVAFPVAVLTTTASSVVYLMPGRGQPWLADLAWNTVLLTLVVTLSYAVGARRAALASARHEQELTQLAEQSRVAGARLAERNRIAGEMHDLLAHRISLVALHAHALSGEHTLTSADRERVSSALGEQAQLALSDLRDVLGVLNTPVPGAPTPATRVEPPGLSDLSVIFEEAALAGQVVTLSDTTRSRPPERLSSIAYHVVRESLTNARKHTDVPHVDVTLAGGPGGTLTVRAENAVRSTGAGTGPAGSGRGLAGLRERVELIGGTLRHGHAPQERFYLEAQLPWPT